MRRNRAKRGRNLCNHMILTCPPKTGPCWMRGFSILIRWDRPIWGDLHEQEASYTWADHIQAERSRSAIFPGPERPCGLQDNRGFRADAGWTLESGNILHARWGEGPGGALEACLVVFSIIITGCQAGGAVYLKNPKTGEVVSCSGHLTVWLFSSSSLAAQRGCINDFQIQGYVRIAKWNKCFLWKFNKFPHPDSRSSRKGVTHDGQFPVPNSQFGRK